MKNKVNLKGGISLIVLVITIVVIIILAATVILGLGDNNPIENAKKASIMSTIDTFKSELSINISNELLKNTNLEKASINKTGDEILELIESMKDKKLSNVSYTELLKIENGELTVNIETLSYTNLSEENKINLISAVIGNISSDISSYEKDGMLAHYDGILNTNTSSHDSSSTTWYDLSGNNYIGIINGTINWGENHLKFNGENNYVELGKINPDYVTLEVVFETNVIKNGQFLVGNWEIGGYGLGIWNDGRGIVADIYNDSKYNKAYWYNNKLQKDTKYCCQMTYDGSIINFYINGNLVASNTKTSGEIVYTYPETLLLIGTNPPGIVYPLNGNVYSVRVYNRALNDYEIKKNYLVDKARFDI